MDNFSARRNDVINFLDEVRMQREQEAHDNAFKNSEDYKLKCLDKEQDNAKGVCLDMVFSKLYKDALPLNNDYKVAHAEDLDAEMKDFINSRCPKGMSYYIHEGIRRGSESAKKIMDETDKIVNDDYNNKALNIEKYKPEDLVFKADDALVNKIDVMNRKLDLDNLSDTIKSNVKMSAISEIQRAKKAENDAKAVETELANDINVRTEAQIDHALALKDINTVKDFEPSLFQGIMINKMNKLQHMSECGVLEPTCIYNTLADFGLPEPTTEDVHFATVEELAFVEAVKEYTKLNIIKALKLERFDLNDVRNLAYEYASNIND